MAFDDSIAKLKTLDEKAVLRDGANLFLQIVQSNTPVDTGELLESEHLEEDGNAINLVADAPHAIFVEFGTDEMEAQSFIRKSMEDADSQIARVIGEAAVREMKKVL